MKIQNTTGSFLLGISVLLLFLPLGLFAKPNEIPEWVHNKNSVYPERRYLSQIGTAKDKEKSKTEALAAISRYLKTTVESNLSTTFTAANNKEKVSVVDETKISSDIELFGVQFTEPYYVRKEKKWYCVAFIDRAQAWVQYQPQIEQEKITFYSFFNKASDNPNLLARIDNYKAAWNAGYSFMEALSFGRIINPVEEQKYKADRENIALIPQLLAATIEESPLYLDISSDYENLIKNAVGQQLSDYGFPLVSKKSSAMYTVKVEVDTDLAYSDEIYSFNPELSLTILWKETKSMFKYSCRSKKVAAYHKDKVLKNGLSQLANDVTENLEAKLNETFNF